MKRYVFALALTIAAFTSCAQGTIPSQKNQQHSLPDIKDGEIDRYAGTWVSKQGDKIFTLKLKKVSKNIGTTEMPHYYELLSGEYSFIVDGKEIVNTIGNDSTYITGSSQGKKGFITIYLKDKVSGKNGEGTMTLLNSTTVKWQIGDIKGHTFFGNDKNKSFTIPTNLTLKRVE